MPEIRVIEPVLFQSTAKLRVCAYARVSSDSEDQKNSFASQVNYYTKYIQAHDDWTFIDIYADQGITGTSALKRDEFLRLMRDCRQGKIDRILVKSVSRFARNAQDCIEAVRELRQLRVTVYFEKEHINTSSMSNEMFLSMMSAFAQEESISISKNMRKGAVMRMKNGTFRLSQIPYGYRYNDEGVLSIHKEEAEIVRWIYQSFLSGKGMQKIAAELEKQKVPKLRGEPIWSKHGVFYILTNERYSGDELFRKSYRSENLPFKKIDNHGEKTQFFAENTHEAIVSKEIFDKVQELLQTKKEKHGKKQPVDSYSFTKMLRCSECGSYLYHRVKPKGPVWICSQHLHNSQQCSAKGVSESVVCQAFLTLIGKLVHNRKVILEEYQYQIEKLKDREFIAHSGAMEINKQIAELLEQSHTLHRLRAKECIDSAFFISQTNEIDQRLAKLRKKLRKYRDLNDYRKIIDDTQIILEALQDADLYTFQSGMFHKIVRQVLVSDDHLKFQMINGLEFDESIERRLL